MLNANWLILEHSLRISEGNVNNKHSITVPLLKWIQILTVDSI